MRDDNGWNVVSISKTLDYPNEIDLFLEGAFATQMAFAKVASQARVTSQDTFNYNMLLDYDLFFDINNMPIQANVTVEMKYKHPSELDLIDLYKIILQMKGYNNIIKLRSSQIIAERNGNTWMFFFLSKGLPVLIEVYLVKPGYTLQNISDYLDFWYQVSLSEFLITSPERLNELKGGNKDEQ